MSRILPHVLGRWRFGAGHAVSLPWGSSWLGADPHQRTCVGLPFSQQSLKEQLVLLHCSCFGQQCQLASHQSRETRSLLQAVACRSGRRTPKILGQTCSSPVFDGCWAEWMWCLDRAQQKLVKEHE